MPFPLLLSLSTAILFYVLIPLGGAFWVRGQWRLFRHRVMACSLKSDLCYADLKQPGEGFLGEFRFLGTLQAIQGDDIVWVTNGSISLPVHLRQVIIYTLPHSFLSSAPGGLLSLRESLPDEIPRRINWNTIFSLPEGTRVLLCGALHREKGQLIFKNTPSEKLVVIIYDGSEDSILDRCIWGGRQKNEYFNDFTPWSIILGILLLLLEAYFFYHQPLTSVVGRITVLFGIAPLTVVLPPGVLFFELYRILWRRGRIFRAERDLIRLPLRFWPGARTIEQCGPVSGIQGDTYGFIRYPTGREALKHNPKERLLDLAIQKDVDSLEGACYGFGVLPATGEGGFNSGKDALTGVTLLPGDPFVLASRSARKARRMQLFSGLAFTAGMGLNLILLFLLANTLLP